MATQKITIIKSNEAYNNSFEFDIPEEAGTYNLSFTRENNAGTINAGNFIVDETERTYQLKLALSNGQEVVAGTFKTQVANKPTVLTLNNTTGAEIATYVALNGIEGNSYTLKMNDNVVSSGVFGALQYDTNKTNIISFGVTIPTGQSVMELSSVGICSFDNGVFQKRQAQSASEEIDPVAMPCITGVSFGSNYKDQTGGLSTVFTGATLGAVTIPSYITYIGEGSFSNSGVSEVVFKNGKLAELCTRAFADNPLLTDISLPSALKYIYPNVFKDCSLTYVVQNGIGYLPLSDGSLAAVEVVGDVGTTPIISANCSLLGGIFSGNTTITSIEIPQKVEYIGSLAFYGATALTDISFEAGSHLLGIGEDGSFRDVGAASFNFPQSLKEIKKYRNRYSLGAAISHSGGAVVDFGENSQLEYIGMYSFSASSTVYLGNKITSAKEIVYKPTNSAASFTFYFDYSASDPVLFDPTKLLAKGSSKGTMTYNIYTDSPTIKDGVLTSVDEYTIVNVYHYDGSAWA